MSECDIVLGMPMETHLSVTAVNNIIHMQLYDYLSGTKKGFEFTPSYMGGWWDGVNRFYDAQNSRFPMGLLGDVKEFAKIHNYTLGYSFDPKSLINTEITEEVEGFLDTIFLNPKYQRRDYQINAMVKALYLGRGIIRAATASGKSFILYGILRYLTSKDKKILLIVPNINLVTQMYRDFEDYGFSNIEQLCSVLYGDVKVKKEFDRDKQIIISTFQSLIKQPEAWFYSFDAMLIDETHTARSETIQSIAQMCRNARYRIGVTGTMPRNKVDQFKIKSFIGSIIHNIPAKQLMDVGVLSQVNIRIMMIHYPDEFVEYFWDPTVEIIDEVKDTKTKKLVQKVRRSVLKSGGKDHIAERKQLIEFGYRFQAIWNLIATGLIKTEDNTIILVNYISEIDAMIKILKDNIPQNLHHIIHRISGSVNATKRDGVFDLMTNSGGNITVATYDTMSTGINIKRLNNIVLGSQIKEDTITLMQSIGRVLRVHDTKEVAYVYDMVDYIPKGNRDHGKKNHGYIALTYRLRAYIEEQYPIVGLKVINSDIGPVSDVEFDLTEPINDSMMLDDE